MSRIKSGYHLLQYGDTIRKGDEFCWSDRRRDSDWHPVDWQVGVGRRVWNNRGEIQQWCWCDPDILTVIRPVSVTKRRKA